MRELRVVRADPAGNITLFVLTPVEKAECAAVAAKLLAIEALKAEQVGFIFPNGHMEMEAGEFCGNASRAYGYLLAKQQGLKGRHTMRLSVSGCDHPVAVTVDMDAGTASAEMPLPKLVEQVEVAGTAGTLVHLAVSHTWWSRVSRPAGISLRQQSRSLRKIRCWRPMVCASSRVSA